MVNVLLGSQEPAQDSFHDVAVLAHVVVLAICLAYSTYPIAVLVYAPGLSGDVSMLTLKRAVVGPPTRRGECSVTTGTLPVWWCPHDPTIAEYEHK